MYYEVKGEWPGTGSGRQNYIERYIYCPLSNTESEEYAYDIDENGR